MASQAINLSDADWLAIEREGCRRSLSQFIKLAWHIVEPGQKYIHSWHIDAICKHLEAVTDGRITRLLINIPPGTMKSMIVSVFWPAWEWGAKGMAHHRFIGASHSEDLATRDNMKMRRLIQSDWYQRRWPISLASDQNAKTYFENDKTGWRQSCPVRSMTGKRGDRVIWDDPHSVEGAFSNADRITTLRVFTETIPTRLNNPDKSAIVVVMQRLHDVDVAGYIIKNDLGYVTLILPMEFESNRRCSTSIGFIDPRTTDGELLFPDRFPQWVVDRDKKIMGSYAVAGQFQQRPSPRGGGIIKGGSFGRYARAPAILFRKIFADTAQKTGERNDYSVFEEYGIGDDNKLYLLSMIRGKWEAPELKRQCIDFWNKCNARTGMGALREMAVEDKASGTGLIQDIKREGKIPIVAIQRDKDKLTRVMDVVSYIEAGYVMIPEDAPFASDFIAECEAFTADDSHLHDDQIDPLLDAINDMLANRNPDYMPSVRVI